MDGIRTVWMVLECKVQKSWMVGIEGKIQERGVRGLFAGKNVGSGAFSQDASMRARPPQASGVGPPAPQASGVGGGQTGAERVGERRPRPEFFVEVPRKCHGSQSEGILRERPI